MDTEVHFLLLRIILMTRSCSQKMHYIWKRTLLLNIRSAINSVHIFLWLYVWLYKSNYEQEGFFWVLTLFNAIKVIWKYNEWYLSFMIIWIIVAPRIKSNLFMNMINTYEISNEILHKLLWNHFKLKWALGTMEASLDFILLIVKDLTFNCLSGNKQK